MDELTQTRNHLLTTTTIRSIRVTLRHSLGLIALLGAGIGLAGCGNSANARTPCEIQLGDAERSLLECTLQVATGGSVESAGCSDDFLKKVAQVRDQYSSSDECPADAETSGLLAGLAASFAPDDAPNTPMPAVSVNVAVLSAKHTLLTSPGLRPAAVFPGFEELVESGSSARTGDLSSPSQNSVTCNSQGWCVNSLPVTDESTICVEQGACGQTVAEYVGTVGLAIDAPSLLYANPALVTPTSQACTIRWAFPIFVPKSAPPKDRTAIHGSYSILVCPS